MFFFCNLQVSQSPQVIIFKAEGKELQLSIAVLKKNALVTIPGQQGAQPQAQQSVYTYEADKEIALMFKQEDDGGGNMFESDNKIVVTQKGSEAYMVFVSHNEVNQQ